MPRAATAEPKTEPKTHTFYSRHRKLRLIRIPQAVVNDNWGGQITRERFPGVTRSIYEFENGQLTVTDGQDVFPDAPDGSAQDAVQWLRSHPEFNVRFHESGNEPDRPLPSDEDFMDMINEASLELNVDRIVELLREERESHNRASLMTFADRARKRTLALRQQLQEQGPPEPPEAA